MTTSKHAPDLVLPDLPDDAVNQAVCLTVKERGN